MSDSPTTPSNTGTPTPQGSAGQKRNFDLMRDITEGAARINPETRAQFEALTAVHPPGAGDGHGLTGPQVKIAVQSLMGEIDARLLQIRDSLAQIEAIRDTINQVTSRLS